MTDTEVLGIEIKQYLSQAGQRTLVPKVLGRTTASIQVKKAQGFEWTEELFLNQVLSSSGETARTVCEKLLADFQNMGCYIQWGKGATQGGFTPVFRGKNQKYRISPVYAYKTSTKIEIPFNELKPPFHTKEKKQELIAAFNTIDALHFPDNPERPSFDCKLLENDTAYNRFMEIGESMISEIKAYER